MAILTDSPYRQVHSALPLVIEHHSVEGLVDAQRRQHRVPVRLLCPIDEAGQHSFSGTGADARHRTRALESAETFVVAGKVLGSPLTDLNRLHRARIERALLLFHMTRTMLAPSRSNSTLALRLDFCMSDHAVLGSPRQMQGRLKLLLAGLTFASTLAILVIVLHTTSSMATTATRERWIRRKRAELRLSAPGPSPSRHLQHTRLNIISQTIPDHLGTADHSITPGPTGLHPEVRRSGSHHNVSILARMPCKDGVCYQYLSLKERQQFENCVKKTQDSEWKFGHVRNGSCHFMKSTELYPVALASFPGSGNTWVRGLLEKATGICTGYHTAVVSTGVMHWHGS